MKTWNCDKCGKNFIKPLVPIYRIYGLFGEVDLCNGCTKALEKWLNNEEDKNE